jgi:hypothetical protein
MKSRRHLQALAIVTILLVALALVPQWLGLNAWRLLEGPSEPAPTAKQAQVIKVPALTAAALAGQFNAKGPKHGVWTLHRGVPLAEYAWQFEQAIKTARCTTNAFLQHEELLDAEWGCPGHAPQRATFQINLPFHPGTARLWLGFRATELSLPALQALNDLSVPIFLVVDPFHPPPELAADLPRLRRTGLALELASQDRKVARIRNATPQLRIDMAEPDVAALMDQARQQHPQAKAFTIAGDGWVLDYETIAKPLAEHARTQGMVLLLERDQMQPALARHCRRLRPLCYEYQRHALPPKDTIATAKSLSGAADLAEKTGRKILILPLDPRAVLQAQGLASARTPGGLEFSPLDSLQGEIKWP